MEQQDVVRFACGECGENVAFPRARCGHVEVCPHCHEYLDVPNQPISTIPSQQPLPTATPEVGKQGDGRHETRRLWFQVTAVLGLTVIPDLLGAIGGIILPVRQSDPLVYQEIWYVVHAIHVSLPMLLILSLTGEPWARFGIVRFSLWIDVPTGLFVWMCGLVGYITIMSVVPEFVLNALPFETSVSSAKPAGLLAGLLVLGSCIATGFAEELVMRGYLLTRFERLLHSTWLALLVTTALFASYHVYQGPAGLIHATAIGLVYGTAYCVQRRLWPLCIAHAITNAVVLMSY